MALIESLEVNLDVTPLAEEEGLDLIVQMYSIVAGAPEETVLESKLRILPEEQPGTLERFDVTISDDAPCPIVLCSESTALRPLPGDRADHIVYGFRHIHAQGKQASARGGTTPEEAQLISVPSWAS